MNYRSCHWHICLTDPIPGSMYCPTHIHKAEKADLRKPENRAKWTEDSQKLGRHRPE